jgi:hypothetical protein
VRGREPATTFAERRRVTDSAIAEGKKGFGARVLSVEGDWDVTVILTRAFLTLAPVVERHKEPGYVVADGGLDPETL